jgi:hypothetical protein
VGFRRIRAVPASLPSGIAGGVGGDDRERAVTVNISPPQNGKAVSRLLDHCTRSADLAEAKPEARERLEAALGGELSRRLVGALSGDHRLPARLLV